MTQTINYVKNPRATTATAFVSRTGATASISTDTFTSWPPQGASSHKIVATGTAVATVGMPNVDRPAAAVGQVWSASVLMRSSQARTCQVAVVFYDTVGGTLGTALLTVPTSASFTAGEIKTLTVSGATAPASTASVDVQVSRNAGGGAATSDAVHFESITLTMTATAQDFRDPETDFSAVWSGTDNASTQIWYDPAFTVTAASDMAPSPRATILIEDLWPSADTIDVLQHSSVGSVTVRDALGGSPTSQTFVVTDYELPPGLPVTYQARQYNSSGDEVGLTGTATPVTVSWDSSMVIIQDPLAPEMAVMVEGQSDFADTVQRRRAVELQRRGVDTVALMGPLGLLEGVPLRIQTRTVQDGDLLWRVLTESTEVLVRSMPSPVRTPPCLYVVIPEPVQVPVDVQYGGGWVMWPLVGHEVSRSDMPVIVSVLSYTLFKTVYATYTAAKVDYATYTEAKLNPPTEA